MDGFEKAAAVSTKDQAQENEPSSHPASNEDASSKEHTAAISGMVAQAASPEFSTQRLEEDPEIYPDHMGEIIGCWKEAQRADRVAAHLLRCRAALGPEHYDHVNAVLKEVESLSRILRDIYDLFPIYRSRVPMAIYDLSVLLPAVGHSLQQMMVCLDNDSTSSQRAWNRMCERMGEQGGMTIPSRFVMFLELSVQILRLLSSSSLYDRATLYLLRMRTLRLRRLQGIPDPLPPTNFDANSEAVPPHTEAELDKRHWSEKIFDDQPHATTGLRHRRDSVCFGPPMADVRLGLVNGSQVLLKLPFNKNRLSVTFYMQPTHRNDLRILCRWMDKHFHPLYSCYGVHELRLRRRGSSLQFRRWSQNRGHPVLWLALFFKTWEQMVLFHCTFTAARFRSPLTISIASDEYLLDAEKRLFQGKIVDDGFEHILTVLQDERCGGLRLLASVRSGELKKCPVWTAFITYQSASPDWMDRRSRHRIWLRDIHAYVFCQNYEKDHQLKTSGEFEIYFVNEEAADAFQDIFEEESDSDIVIQVQERGSEVIAQVAPSVQSSEGSMDSAGGVLIEDDSKRSDDADTKYSEVARWQSFIEKTVFQEDLSSVVFENCIKVFPAVLHAIREKPDVYDSAACNDLREEFRKFYVWNDTISTGSGELGSALSTSRNLKEAVFRLMAQWARALCGIPRVLPELYWQPVDPEIAKLEVAFSKMEQVAGVLSRDPFALGSGLKSDLIPDDLSDSASIESIVSVGDITEEMKLCTECLVDLLPSLENPATDLDIEERARAPHLLPDESQPWWPFFLQTQDKFPSAERDLVVRIGEANWRRWKRIRISHATKAEAFGNETVTYKPGDELDADSHYSESIQSSGRYTQTTKSTFSGASIFDKADDKADGKVEEDFEPEEYINPEARVRRGSFSSVRSSIVTNAPKAGQRRIPPMPNEGRNGDEFECFVCQKKIKDIHSRETWKQHIFGDLEPYICTFGGCPKSLDTFISRRNWCKHEYTAHHEQFQKRLGSATCALCLKVITPAKHLWRHLGRHLRELSLASLPPFRTAAEDEEEPEPEISMDHLSLNDSSGESLDEDLDEPEQGRVGKRSMKGKERELARHDIDLG